VNLEVQIDVYELPRTEDKPSQKVKATTIAGAVVGSVGCAAIVGALFMRRRRSVYANASLSHIQPAIPIKTVETINIPVV